MRSNFILFVVGLVVLAGCATTMPPSKEQVNGFRSAKTVRIIVEQSYSEAKDVNFDFEEIARRLFGYAGVAVVKANAESYDATLEIQAEGKAIGAYYVDNVFFGTGRVYQYTGASVWGMISLQSPEVSEYKTYFKWNIKPDEFLVRNAWTRKYDSASAAPFTRALEESFVPKMIDLVGVVYGSEVLITALKNRYYDYGNVKKSIEKLGKQSVEPLITALKDDGSDLRILAAEMLGNIRDPRAVEPLIAALKDDNPDVQIKAIDALEKIGWENINAQGRISLIIAKKDWVALSESNDPGAVQTLIMALGDVNPNVRLGAAIALGKIKDTSAVKALIAALKDEHPVVQKKAKESLVNILDGIGLNESSLMLVNVYDYTFNDLWRNAVSNLVRSGAKIDNADDTTGLITFNDSDTIIFLRPFMDKKTRVYIYPKEGQETFLATIFRHR